MECLSAVAESDPSGPTAQHHPDIVTGIVPVIIDCILTGWVFVF